MEENRDSFYTEINAVEVEVTPAQKQGSVGEQLEFAIPPPDENRPSAQKKPASPPMEKSKGFFREDQGVLQKTYHVLFKQLFNRHADRFSVYEGNERLFYKRGLQLQDEVSESCPPAAFFRYYPTYDDMTNTQLNWYIFWRTAARKGDFLETDTSYYYVYLYELAQLLGVSSPAQGLEQLLFMFAHRKSFDGRLQSALVCFLKDFLLYYDLTPNYFTYLLELDPLLCAQVLWMENLTNFLENKPHGPLLLSVNAASHYKIGGSGFVSKGRYELTERCMETVLAELHRSFLSKSGGMVKKYWGEQRDHRYFPFESTIFFDRGIYRLGDMRVINSHVYYYQKDGTFYTSVPTGWQNGKRWTDFLSGVTKYVESRLRKACHFPYALKEPELAVGVKKTVDKAIDTFFEEGRRREQERKRKEFHVDLDTLEEKRAETDAINNRLIEELGSGGEDAQVIAQISPDPLGPKQSDEAAQEQNVTDGPHLAAHEKTALAILLKGGPVKRQLEEIAAQAKVFPLVLVDRLNEAFFEMFGDTVIDTNEPDPYIYDEYRGQLQQWIEPQQED